ncbi:MAG: hypothetical protein Q8909_09610, partial [Bacteroidota bacterium]|nr:hypothetical protein [Bacteroidota bacterium]
QKELDPIEKGLASLNLHIPVYVVSINKTFSEDIIGFDATKAHLMPHSGTYLPIGQSRYLLYNNALTDDAVFNASDGYPLPMKVTIQCFPAKNEEYQTDKANFDSPEIKESIKAERQSLENELLRQVCLFSRLYWKSVKKQSMPVTLKYPEMLAQIVPHFSRPEIPRTGKETLWFL